MRVAELAYGDSGQFWQAMVSELATDDLADMEAQREAGLRQQTPGTDFADIWSDLLLYVY